MNRYVIFFYTSERHKEVGWMDVRSAYGYTQEEAVVWMRRGYPEMIIRDIKLDNERNIIT